MNPTILPWRGMWPQIDASAFIAPTAAILGDVRIAADANIWFGCTLRGESRSVIIGRGSNIQDGAVLHIGGGGPTRVGDHVTVGHMALIHGCHLEDRCFVGMQATVMDDAVVESGAMVAAGALVTQGKRVPAGELWAGRPAKKMRDLGEGEIAELALHAPHYVELAREYMAVIGLGAPDNQERIGS
jgi:carbonic anhydrase/acetyltransferase-like protein (isoleucine patch superfamily)